MEITNLDNQKLTAYNKLIENYEILLNEDDSQITKAFEELFIAKGLLLEYFNESSDEELLYFIAINFKTIKKILQAKDTDIYSLDDLAKKILLYKYCDKENLAVIGEENAMKIAYNDEFITESTDENRSSRIYYATKYNILSKKYYQTTIPYLEVTVDGITVKRYKNNNPDLLVAGIDTDACFKIFGVDNDFLLYTLFDKNGIVLKISDEEGKLIGRISGFRNGNVVYLHQARTIYDKLSNHSNEITNTIKRMRHAIETFSKKLVEITSKDEHPIEHVVILRGFGYNDDDRLKEVNPKLIELNPMDNVSPDWVGFKTIEGVKYSQKTGYFTTSYQTTKSILLLASSKTEGINSYQDIISYDVPSEYLRPREIPKTITDNNFLSVIPILRRIDATYALYFDEEYIPVKKLDDIESITYGEDWYYIVKNNGLTFECFIPLDPRAEIELKQCKAFYQNKDKNPEISSADKLPSKTR